MFAKIISNTEIEEAPYHYNGIFGFNNLPAEEILIYGYKEFIPMQTPIYDSVPIRYTEDESSIYAYQSQEDIDSFITKQKEEIDTKIRNAEEVI